jgi:undecaprenyl-diphosphatase
MQVEADATAQGRTPLDHVADVASIASDFGVIWVAVAALQVATGSSSWSSAARRLGAAGMVSLTLTRLLKHFFGVARPPNPDPGTLARMPTSSSFPSGHTLAAFTSALAVPRSARGRAVAALFAATVGWARLRVGHHRPSDVIAGAAIGGAAGAAVAVLLDRTAS